MPTFEENFLKYSGDKLEQYASGIQDCLRRLSDEQVWMRGSAAENSAGNLILHLCGNVRQWIGFGIAGQADNRHRDAEFAARGGVSAGELSHKLADAVKETVGIIRAQTPETLAQSTNVQNYELTKMEAIYHVVEHFSGHTGQIILLTKILTGEDLGYYKHLSASASRTPAPDPIP